MNIDPVAFTLGPITVRWYGLLIATAMLIAAIGGCRVMRKAGIDEDDFLTIFMVTIVVAILGARAYYVLFELPYYLQHPGEIIAIWHGGLAVHGGLIAGVLAIYFGCKHYRISFWQFVDIVAPFMILGQAIGRWGNFFNQEAYGYITDVRWAMYIDGAYRHPTFLYESLADGLVQILDRCASQYKFTLRSDRQSNKLLLRLRSGAAVLLQVQVGQLLGKSGVCLWMHPGSRSCDDHAYQGCVTWSALKCQYRLENRGLLLDLTPEIEFPSLAGLLERLDREIQTILGVSA